MGTTTPQGSADGIRSLSDLLRDRSAEDPGAPLYRLVRDDGAEAEALTRADLLAGARGIAAHLQRSVAAGERVLLLYPPGLDLVVAFFGALLAGTVPVLAPPPRRNRNRRRVLSILDDARPARVLTSSSIEPSLGFEEIDSIEAPPAIVPTDRIDPAEGEAWRDPGLGRDDVAFLQYTSGSTAAPRGVVLTHGNLLANSALIHEAFAMTRRSHVVSWLPPYHDMGLIGGILQPLFAGCDATLMSPVAFLRRPRFWLEVLTATGGTTSGGPNFAYELCLRRVPEAEREGLDLSRWRAAFNGAEPVRADTLGRFAEAFAPAGFRPESWLPCYGLAEATLMVTGAGTEAPPVIRRFDDEALRGGRVEPLDGAEAPEAPGRSAKALASSGRPIAAGRQDLGPTEVAVVSTGDDGGTGRVLPEGAIGEIWVRGPSVARGYWDRPDATGEAFGAVATDADGESRGGFLRTGDLGFLAEGELFVTGRIKDLVILRGRNHHPQDLEASAEASHPELRLGCGAAFSIDDGGEERLVLVQEVERNPTSSAAEIAAAIRDAIAGDHEVRVHEVVLARPGAVPKTTSGKVQRSVCRELYRSGELKVHARLALAAGEPAGADLPNDDSLVDLDSLPAEARREAIEREVLRRAARVLRTDVEPDRPLTAAGLDSLAAVELQQALAGRLGLSGPIPLRRLLEGATPRELAAEIAAGRGTGGGDAEAERPVGDDAPTTGRRPLTEGQRALWLLERTAPGNAALHLMLAADVDGLDAGVLRQSLAALAARHEALRTTFGEEDGEPYRRVHDRLAPEVAELAGDADEPRALSRLAEWAHRPFELDREAPLRAALLPRPGGGATVAFVLHHLAGDLHSAGLLLRELGDLYREALAGAALAEAPGTSYEPYLRWCERRLDSPRADDDREHWRRRLEGATAPLDLPTDRPRPTARPFEADSVTLALDARLTAALGRLGRAAGATPFALLLAGWQAVLARHAGTRGFTVGTATSGRRAPELAGVVGYCVDPVALPDELDGDPGFGELARRVGASVTEALERTRYPFARLIDELAPARDGSRPPLFQTACLLHRTASGVDAAGDLAALVLGEEGVEARVGPLHLRSRKLPSQRLELELVLAAAREGESLRLSLRYLTALFDRTSALRLANALAELLRSAVAEPERPVSTLAVATRAERHQVLAEWNDTRRRAEDEPLRRRLDEALRARPDAVALVRGASRLTYGALDRRVETLARRLRRRGAGPGRPVALFLPRSFDAMVGLLAILRTGAAYVPLDPEQPGPRLAAMAESAAVALAVTRPDLEDRLPEGVEAVAVTGETADEIAGEEVPTWTDGPVPASGADLPFYVIFTSGSTGRPKGAVVGERGFGNLVSWYGEELSLDAGDRVLWLSALGFDLTQKNLFAPLLCGGELHLPDDDRYDPAALARGIERERITRINCTPSAFYPLAEEGPSASGASLESLRTVVLGGEPIARERIDRWRAAAPAARAEVVNTYGPTEASDVATFHRLPERPDPGPVPVGRPLPGVRAHVVDRHGLPAPVGAPGELVLAGVGVGAGYLGRPARTADAFRPDSILPPLAPRSPSHPQVGTGTPPPEPLPPEEGGTRIYRTGDLARRRADGAIEYRGRVDQQVKVRGHRIEPGEIEAALRAHPGVREAAVVARAVGGADPRLVAYLVPDAKSAAPVLALRRLERAGRLDGRERIVLPNGLPIVHLNRSETEFVYREIFEEESYLRQGIEVEPGSVVFDVGANIGLFALFLARRHPGVRIYAFEPVPPIFELLRLNLEIHGVPGQLFGHGLASTPGTATFEFFPHVSILSGRYADAGADRETVRRFLRTESELRGVDVSEEELARLLDERLERRSFRCPLRTLSQVIAETGVERIDLLKVDVEKAELDVLEGLDREDWPKVRQVVAEVHDLDGRLARIVAMLEEQGFEVAVEREEALRDVPLYNLAARRPEAVERTARARPAAPAPAWADEAALLEDVRARAAGRLPEPMLPSAWVVLEELPTTRSGKLDRLALPAPDGSAGAGARHEPPATPTEEVLAALWGELLDRPLVGAEDHFFEQGGHSLLATRLISRLRRDLGVELPVSTVFEAPRLRALAARVDAARRRDGRGGPQPVLAPVPRAESLPLSFSQERLWFLDRLEPDTALYNVPGAVELTGDLRVAALARAFGAVVRRHESLRTLFPAVDGRPVQTILPAPPEGWPLPMPVVDLSGLAPAPRAREARRVSEAEQFRPFDLAGGAEGSDASAPLLRVRLLCLGPAEHTLVVALHHVVSDGWSMGVLVRELSAFFDGSSPAPPPLPVQYADFAVWQREGFSGEARERRIEPWRRRLAGAPPSLALPYDRPAGGLDTPPAGRVRRRWPPERVAAVRALGSRRGATPFMVLLAAFDATLHRWTGEDDLVVGTPVANRTVPEVEPLIGCFVNSLALRVGLDGEPSFLDLLDRVRAVALEAYEHQEVPFEALVEELAPERRLGTNPLFQVFFLLQNAPAAPLELPGLTLALHPAPARTLGFDLALGFTESSGGLDLELEYAADRFDRATAERLAGRLETLLAGALARPERRVAQLPVLSPAERHQVRIEWAHGPADRPAASEPFERLAQGAVLRGARERPDAVALISEEGTFSYAGLARGAAAVAAELRRHGVRRGDRVALCAERSAELLLGLLGILEAGAAYLPLDPAYPAERLAFMIEDGLTGARRPVLLAQAALVAELPVPEAVRVLAIEEALGAPSGDTPAREPLDGEDLAAVIYTSGSTGKPKGVALPHRAVAGYAHRLAERMAMNADERGLQFAAIGFDTAAEEIYTVWAAGGSLVLRPRELFPTFHGFEEFLARHRITFVDLPSSYWHEWTVDLDRGGRTPPPSVARLAIGSEASSVDKLRLWRRIAGDRVAVYNGYGPTEVTVAPVVDAPDLRRPVRGHRVALIGRPIAGYRAFVLDRELRPVAPGGAGEILLGGPSLARGYLGRPALTAEKFLPDPVGGDPAVPGERLYRTGDLGRFLPDGALEYLGRADHQVKIRGFRVEPGEIEAHLLERSEIDDAVVVARRDGDGPPRLIAYLVAAGDAIDSRELAGELRSALPAHMVPSAFVVLDALPRNANGKVDRAALPAVAAAHGGEADPPRTPTETALAALWSEVLGVPSVGRRDRFFDLGGHSLLATQLASRVRERLGVEMPLRTLFEAPDLAALAAAIDDGGAATAPRESIGATGPIAPTDRASDAHPPLSFAQERLWFLDRFQPERPLYNLAAAHRLDGDLDLAALARALGDVERRHEVLRTTYRELDGAPVQVVHPPAPGGPAVPVVDLSRLAADRRDAELDRLAREEALRPFDLVRGPVARYRVVRLAPACHAALVTLHHVAADGWSVGVLVGELNALYAAHHGEPGATVPPALPIQYADFAAWQRRHLDEARIERDLEHWRERLAGAPPVLELPTDRPRPPVYDTTGALHRFRLPPETARALERFARDRRATLFTVLLTGFAALLQRWTGQDDLVTGTGIAGRERPEVEPLIGFFVQTLPLRLDLSGDPTAAEAVERARETVLDAYAHREVPFERLVQAIDPERDPARAPIFQDLLVFQNAPAPALDLPGLCATRLATVSGTAKFDLSLFLEPSATGGGLDGMIEYPTALYDRSTIERLAGHLARALDGLAEGPDRRLAALPVLSGAEHRQLLAWSSGGARFREDTLPERFAVRAAEAPERVAVVCDGEHLSYGALARRSAGIAADLAPLLAGDATGEPRVGLLFDRSADLVTAILGTLAAGAAYVPLDPAWPAERLDFVVRDAGVRRVLCDPASSERAAALPAEATMLGGALRAGCAPPAPPADPDRLAYVIYTSGSTGRPKGALIRHGSVTRLLDGTASWLRAGADDTWSLFHSYAFDFSVWEIWGALAHGGRVAVVPYWVSRSPEAFHELLERERVTILDQTPSAFRQLVEADATTGREGTLPALRTVIFGGEALEPSTLARWCERHGTERPRLVNMYGITETTVHVTERPITADDVRAGGRSPIGAALPDLALRVLDARGRPVPVGVPGELLVGGPGLARGYLGRPGLTAERFLPDPIGGEGGARLYRSGDLVRYRPGGDLEYLGRIDTQVKIRGFRVELGEIEEALAAHPAVEGAVVAVRDAGDADRRLIAYVVPDAEGAPLARRAARLQSALAEGEGEAELTELPNGLPAFHLNRAETDFLYRELFEEEAYLRHGVFLHDGARVFDVGAHVGLFSLALARRWRDLEIFAFEPVPPVHRALEANLELHGLCAHAFRHALGREAGRAAFDYYPHATVLSGRTDLSGGDGEAQRMVERYLRGQAEREGIDVSGDELRRLLADRLERRHYLCPVRPLSHVIRETGVDRIDLLKIDVEGAEVDVLDGVYDEHWPLIHNLAIEVHDVGGRVERVRERLESRGFRVRAETVEGLEGTRLANVYAARFDGASLRQGAAVRPPAPPAPPAGPGALVRALRERCGEQLPGHMVPSEIVLLDAFPLTPNGKIDRRALDAIGAAAGAAWSGAGGREPFVPPRTETETRLAAIWRELLGVERVGAHSDFFALGGHSLLATRLLARVRRDLGAEVGLRAFFEAPTLAAVARAIDEAPRAAAPAPREAGGSGETPTVPAGERPIRRLRRGGRSLASLGAAAGEEGEP